MRLNFSGASEEDLREGVRRIGAVVAEQVALYGTLTGAPAAAAPDTGTGTGADPALADVLRLPSRESGGGQASRGGEPR